MSGEKDAVKKVFTKETAVKAGKVTVGIAAAEIIDFGLSKIKIDGKEGAIPNGVGGFVAATLAALGKQPAIVVGALADSTIVITRTVTGYDVTKPKDGIDNMKTNNTDEKVV